MNFCIKNTKYKYKNKKKNQIQFKKKFIQLQDTYKIKKYQNQKDNNLINKCKMKHIVQ